MAKKKLKKKRPAAQTSADTAEAVESRKVSLFEVPEQPMLRTGGFFHRNLFILLSFGIPFLFMFIAFAIKGCQPFGTNQTLVTDLWHQYFPFLVDFQDKLKGGESLFWSWTQGGGTNYFSLIAYYLASPLNIVTIFLPTSIMWLNMYLTFSIALKIGLAGCFFAMFLRYTFKRDDISVMLASVGFALCAHFMGYYWCDIWLDTVALTPLVVMGFVALMREGKYRLYVITLALSVLANYYIGLFTCAFMVICFIGYSVLSWGKDGFKAEAKKFGFNLLKVFLCSVVALMITAVLIIPAYFGLQTTHAAGSAFPTGYQINIGSTADLWGTLDALKQVAGNTMAFVKPTNTVGLPNIACGIFSLVLGIMFMVSRKIRLRDKILAGALILFLCMSFIIRQLDYIWHGFHFTNMIPYRFSYLLSFILVLMAFKAFTVIHEINLLDVLITTVVTALFIICYAGSHAADTDQITLKLFGNDVMISYFILALVGSIILAAATLALLAVYSKKIITTPVLCILISAVVLIQGGITAFIGVEATGVTTTYDYPRGDNALTTDADGNSVTENHTAKVVEYMKEREKNTPELWRGEFTSTQTLCDSALNGFNGVSMFNSLTNESITRFAENFGLMGWLAGNRYTYAESSPVTDLFMNLKYMIARDGNLNDLDYWNEIFSDSSVKLFENKSYIPMGTIANSTLKNYGGEEPEDTYNPFDNQNEFFKLATGVKDDVYTKVDIKDVGHTDMTGHPVYRLDYGYYQYNYQGLDETPVLKFNYEAPEDGYYYAYTLINDVDNVTVSKNDSPRTGTSSFYIKRPYIMSIGQYSKGERINIDATLKQGASGTMRIYVNKFNSDVFDKGVEVLKKSVMTTTNLTGSSMAGTIDADRDGLFLTSIPYESGRTKKDTLIGKLLGSDNEGWTATVDGKPVEIKPVAHALVAFDMTKGKHEVSMSYLPKGFIKGTIITCTGLVLFIGYTLFVFIRKKKAKKTAD